jgi:asparagine synthase (glutamine-hydrolysing)
MTAIAGLVRHDQGMVDRGTLERMLNVLAPYGVDAQHCRSVGSAGFVRALLRSTPEDALDHQPCVDANSGWTLVFDGRIDNREELASALGIDSSRLQNMADAELVLHAWVRWERASLARLLGDFAIAAWHARSRRLMLSRDYLGARPLFWCQGDGFHAFASLPKALFAIPGVPRELSEEGLHDFLALVPMLDGKTLYRGIQRVMPGQCVVVEDGRTRSETWYSFDSKSELRLRGDDQYVDAFAEHLERAVARRLRAVGPVASELSSGFDSSTITAVAAAQLAARGQSLLAYTSVPREGFSDRTPAGTHADEWPGASAVAARYPNIEHIRVRSDGTSPMQGLDFSIEALDRPTLNPCNGAWVDRMRGLAAARGVRVMLNGGVGNMSISYDGRALLPALFGRGQWIRWQHEASALLRTHPGLRWRKMLVHSLAAWMPQVLWQRWEASRGRGWNLPDYSAINPAFMAKMDTAARARRAGVDLTYRDVADGRSTRIRALQLIDIGEYSLGANLVGLETRDPTADRELVEFCLAVPESQYLRDGKTRWLLRRAMAGRLPPEILDGRSRGLQAADWYESTEQELPRIREELERLQAHPSAGKYLDLPALKASIEAWPRSGWHSTGLERRYRLKLLRGLSAGAFVRYVENDNR